jgi:hypothetical protein
MAVFDTHKAFTAFKEAGFTDTQAQALIDQSRESSDALVTKGDLDVRLRELEQRMTIRLGAMLFVVAGLQVVIISILLALFNGS